MFSIDVLVDRFLVVKDFAAFWAHILPGPCLGCVSSFNNLPQVLASSQTKKMQISDKPLCAKKKLHTHSFQFFV
jgi:hypothetical protein